MNITLSTGGRRVLSSGTAILNSSDSDLKFEIEHNEFSFCIILKFINRKGNEQSMEKEVKSEDNTLILKCTNFNNALGTGTLKPLPIATVSGKEIFLHFWSYLLGNKESTRKVEYTFLEEE